MLEFDLVENALHSLSEALSYYHEGDEDENAGQYKFCILLTSHCAELILKEILRRSHPSLVFENIDKIKNMSIDDDIQTVGYKLAAQRVKNLCGIELGRYENYIIDLGRVRNRVQHYKCSIDGKYYKGLMSESFSAIEFLFLDVLKLNFDDYESVIDPSDISFLHEDATAYDTRKRDIQNEFSIGTATRYKLEYDDNKTIIIPCPICGSNLLAQESKIRCKMCSAEYENQKDLNDKDLSCIISTYVARELGKRKGKLKYPLYECSHCEYETVVYLPQDDKWLCLSCGESFDGMTFCDECGNPIPNDDDISYIAMSDYDTEDYKYLCPDCAKIAKNSENYIGYEIQ